MNFVKFLIAERRDDVLVVSLLRNVGCFSAEDFQDEWQELVRMTNDETIRHAIVDFRRVAYFGSILLELTLYLSRRMQPRGGQVVLCNLSTFGVEVIRAMKFDNLCQLAPDYDQAVALLQSRGWVGRRAT